MRRLRLIKPWRLRTVRQHLNVVHHTELYSVITCCGPRSAEDELCPVRFGTLDIRTAKHSDGRSAHRVIGPVVVAPIRATVCIR